MKRQKNKSGSMLALVALGVLAVGGIVPFLVENTETNQKLTNSIDETNKQIWTLQSAVRNASHKSSQNVLGLKEVTTRKINEPVLDFYYGDKEKGFKSEAQVTCVNAYLNKNQVFVGNIHDKDGYDLSSIKYSEVKPGVTAINSNTIYCWDKYGRLSKLENSKLEPVNVAINNQNKKVWQVVSDGNNPIVLTTELKAVNLKDNNVYEDSYYQFASRSDDFQAAIQNDDRLAIPRNNDAVTKFYAETAVNTKVEDLALSSNHGLVLVKSNDNWQVWGWGNNENKQLICTAKDSENNDKQETYSELVKISDIFSQCKASGNVIADPVIPIQEFESNDMSSEYGFNVNFYAVAAGENFSLAVVSPIITPGNEEKTKGIATYSVIGWGNNTYGQIGCSKGINDENSKEEMTFIVDLSSSVVEDYRDMQAGNNHALFLTKSGKVYSWGGSNDNASVYNVHQVSFKNNPKIVYISAGNGFSSALDEDGNLYSWSVIQGQTGSVVNPISGINTSLFSTK